MDDQKKSLPVKYKVIADSIRTGKRNATLLSDIMRIADIDDRRQAHQIIESLINDYGYVIGASRRGEYRGYYRPANDREFQEISDTFKATIDSMNERHNSLITNYHEATSEDAM